MLFKGPSLALIQKGLTYTYGDTQGTKYASNSYLQCGELNLFLQVYLVCYLLVFSVKLYSL